VVKKYNKKDCFIRVHTIFCLKDHIHNEKGVVALLLVLWVMVILVAIVGEFSYSMRTEVNITRNFKEEEESYQLALAGIERAKIEILSVKEASYVYLNEEGLLVFEGGEEEPVREDTLEMGSFSYTITDEDGKLNINTASLQQLKNLVKNMGLETDEVDTVVDSIIDWRDSNDLHMLNGAEEDYYQSLQMPYSCKDAPFDVVEELLLVRGVTPEIFYGSDKKEKEKEYRGLVKYLTTWGTRKINVNTAPQEVLEALLGIQVAEDIVTQREENPLYDVRQAARGGKLKSMFFTIVSTGKTSDGPIKRTIKTTLKHNNGQLKTLYWNDNYIG
jgi:general secretion pathway protein K